MNDSMSEIESELLVDSVISRDIVAGSAFAASATAGTAGAAGGTGVAGGKFTGTAAGILTTSTVGIQSFRRRIRVLQHFVSENLGITHSEEWTRVFKKIQTETVGITTLAVFWQPLLVSGVVITIAKELWDWKSFSHTFSWKDLQWGLIGWIAGLLIVGA